jgi:hypothetical protein
MLSPMKVYVVVDVRSNLDHPLGEGRRRAAPPRGAERFLEQVRGDGAELATHLRVEERELEAGGPN